MRSFLKFIGISFLIIILVSMIGGFFSFWKGDDSHYDLHRSNLAVIEIDGVIMESLPILEQFDDVRKNSNFKALVVRLNSPGGAVGASQEIYMELKKLREKMPVIVSMGDVAASGGLYVSLGASKIVALPGTLTGSMGVLLQLTNLSRLLNRVYVDPITLKSGELKDAGNPSRPLDPKAKKYLEGLIGKSFEGFRAAVKMERKLKDETLALLSDGRVVEGSEALELGLVDKLGTFRDAIDLATSEGKIDGEPKIAFISRKPKGWLSQIIEESTAPVRGLLKEKLSVLQYRWEPLP